MPFKKGHKIRLGMKHTKETKAKIKAKRALQVITDEHKKSLSVAMKKSCAKRCTFTHIDKDGYRVIYKPEHPNAMKKGYILEHRFVLSEHIGRPLTKKEMVHHINGDKQDNRIKNLELCLRSEHIKNHHMKKRDSLGKFISNK